MRLVSSRLPKSPDKHFEYLNNFAYISNCIISMLFDFHTIQAGHLIENSKPATVWYDHKISKCNAISLAKGQLAFWKKLILV